jgi:hypothetical protein
MAFVRKTILVLLLTLPLGFAHAQSFEDLLRYGCRELGGGACQYIEYALELPGLISEFLVSFHEEFAVFGHELFSGVIEGALFNIEPNLRPGDVRSAFSAAGISSVADILSEGPAALRERVGGLITDLRRRAGDAPIVRNSADWWYRRAVESNPNFAASEFVNRGQQDGRTVTLVEAAAVREASRHLAEQAASSTATREVMAQVLAPSVGGVGGGDAARLQDRAATAVSSRAALQTLAEGMADGMRQQAVMAGVTNENLKVLAQQNAMTTWELSLAVESLTQQAERQAAEDRAAVMAALSSSVEAGERIGQNLEAVALGAAKAMTPDFEALQYRSLWP